MHGQYSEDLVVQHEDETQSDDTISEPRKYKVFLLNDDYTPMDFVVEIIKRFFHLNEELATLVMLQVHTHGKGLCGVYTHEVAETKVAIVNAYARIHGHPLLAVMEPE
jgi:ATP-dependent Clp protease adaptor protein ClpS